MNHFSFAIRLEHWNHSINPPVTNVRQFRDSVSEGYKSTGHVHQLSKNGLVIRSYKFHGLWPSEVSPIELSWESVESSRRILLLLGSMIGGKLTVV